MGVIKTKIKLQNRVNYLSTKWHYIYSHKYAPLVHMFTVIGNGYYWENGISYMGRIKDYSFQKSLKKDINENVDGEISIYDLYLKLLPKYSEKLMQHSYFINIETAKKWFDLYKIKDTESVDKCFFEKEDIKPFYYAEELLFKKAEKISEFRINDTTVEDIYECIKTHAIHIYPQNLEYFILYEARDEEIPSWLLELALKVIDACLLIIEEDVFETDMSDKNYKLTEYKKIKQFLENKLLKCPISGMDKMQSIEISRTLADSIRNNQYSDLDLHEA